MLTYNMVRALLVYDRQNDEFRWLPRPRQMFHTDAHYRSWNHRYLGKVAGGYDTEGNYRIRVLGKLYRKNRLLYFYEHGEWQDIRKLKAAA